MERLREKTGFKGLNTDNWKRIIILFFKGAIIGVGAILPGISGGVLCVVFGIYKPMMHFLSHPIKAFKASYRLLLPVLIGCGIGFLLLARAVDVLFRVSGFAAIWLFIGLISGTFPSLLRTAGEKGRSAVSWVAFAIAFIVFLCWMELISLNEPINVQPSLLWWLICGVLWGLGMVVPGLSPSAFIIFLGLYQPMTAGIAALSIEVVVPIVIGGAAIVMLSARAINWLFEKAHSIISHALAGVAIASAIAIIPFEAPYSLLDALLYAFCFVAGCAAALLMDRLGKKTPHALADGGVKQGAAETD